MVFWAAATGDEVQHEAGRAQGVDGQPRGKYEEQEALYCQHLRAQDRAEIGHRSREVFRQVWQGGRRVPGERDVRQKAEGIQLYVKFSDEDPVDRAVLVGVHNIKTAVLKVERSLSWRQQEEVRLKREQQKQVGAKRQGTADDQPPKGNDPVLRREQGNQGAWALKSKNGHNQEHPVGGSVDSWFGRSVGRRFCG